MKRILLSFYRNINWKAVIVISILINICSIIDGDWFNWKMNIGLLILVIGAVYYD